MKIAITAVRTVNLGDHGERLSEAYETVEGETVEDLVRRVFPRVEQFHKGFNTHDYTETIEIRVAREAQ